MNTLIALYIWLATTLGVPSGSHDDHLAPGCASQDTQAADTDCDDDSDDSQWYVKRTTHIYNGF